jgi:hypothetical protein
MAVSPRRAAVSDVFMWRRRRLLAAVAATQIRTRSGLQKTLFFYTVSASCAGRQKRCFIRFIGRAARAQTPLIIAKDDSWKKARKARLD